MADFNTHLLGAAGVGSLVATVGVKAGLLTVDQALLATLGGVLGGILPDVDLQYSTPGKALFTLLGLVGAASWLFANLATYTVLEAWAVAIAIHMVARYPGWWLFHQFTVHRGALHSVSAAVMVCFASAAACRHAGGLDAYTSWAVALFVGAGYLVHLLLDELYSVDFLGARVQRSFGSALKLVDTERLFGSAAVLFVTLLLWFLTPDADALAGVWARRDTAWLDGIAPSWLWP